MSGKMPRGSPYSGRISYIVGFGSGCGDGLRMKERVKGGKMKRRKIPKWNLELEAMFVEEIELWSEGSALDGCTFCLKSCTLIGWGEKKKIVQFYRLEKERVVSFGLL